jgi:hypothetical protein
MPAPAPQPDIPNDGGGSGSGAAPGGAPFDNAALKARKQELEAEVRRLLAALAEARGNDGL